MGEEGNLNRFLNNPAASTQNFNVFNMELGIDKGGGVVASHLKEHNIKKDSVAFEISEGNRTKTVFFQREEVDKLASQIGLDLEHDKGKYLWYLQAALVSELPQGWVRETDFKGNVNYHNILNNTTTDIHPNAHEFRVAFAHLLRTQSIKRKMQKLPVWEFTKYEKILLEAKNVKEMGKGLKRMKNMMQKTEESQASVLSKQIVKWLRKKEARLGIGEKIPIIEEGRHKLRFKILINLMDRGARNIEDILSGQDLIKVDLAIDEAQNFYDELVGHSSGVPQFIANSPTYTNADPAYVITMANYLGVKFQKEPYLMWIPRMATCLPLPPFWREIANLEGEDRLFYNIQHDVLINFHPADYFLRQFVKQFRDQYTKMNIHINEPNSKYIYSIYIG